MRPKGARLQFALDQFKGAASNVTEVLACNPFVLVAIPPMLCDPGVIFLFCHVVEQEVTLVHVGIAVDGNRDQMQCR